MLKKLAVGVIFGGQSGEHEVSLVSANSVIKALDKSKYKIIPIGITKQGQWLIYNKPLNILKKGDIINKSSQGIISPDPKKGGLIFFDNEYFATHKKTQIIDIIIPILHGTYGEDGTMQGLFELANIPYVGANVLASAIGIDKIIQKQLFHEKGLLITNYTYFNNNEYKHNKKSILNKSEALGFPLFVKPANLGSSVGISQVKNKKELFEAINYALHYDRKVIIEKALINVREIEVAVLGNDSPQASVPGEIISSSDFYDYNAKYVDGLSETIIPAKLPKNVIKNIQQIATKAFKIINCSGMARVDFLITKNNKIYINELNTIPGFTSISMYPKLWQSTGLTYTKLLDKLIQLAIERHKEKNSLSTTYKPIKKWYK